MTFQLIFEPGMFKDLASYLRAIGGAASAAGRDTTLVMAVNMHSDVQRRYTEGPSPALHPSTLEKRRQGKRPGKTPGVRKYAGVKPLFRSGKMSRLVERVGRASGKTSTQFVRLKPGRRMSGGGRSDMVGAVNEFGGSWFVPIPPWARAYLRALAMGIAGKAKSVRVSDTWSIAFITIPKRPVWVPAFEAMISRQPMEFAKIFGRKLKQRTRQYKIDGKPIEIVFG